MRLPKEHHLVFWIISVIFFAIYLYSLLFNRDSFLDINIHDTYYLITHLHLFQILTLWFGICGLGYWFLFKWQIKIVQWMFWVHLIFSLLIILSYPLGLIEFEPNLENVQKRIYVMMFIVILVLIFILGQVIYLINILLSTLRNKRI